jgi:hypothetical protein
MTTNATGLPADLRAVQRKFNSWRNTRPRICAIPDALWRCALTVYPRYSLHRIAMACHLDSSALKRRLVSARPMAAGNRPRRQRFLEVEAHARLSGEEFVLEMEEEGRTLRVRMSGVETMVEVLRGLRGQKA